MNRYAFTQGIVSLAADAFLLNGIFGGLLRVKQLHGMVYTLLKSLSDPRVPDVKGLSEEYERLVLLLQAPRITRIFYQGVFDERERGVGQELSDLENKLIKILAIAGKTGGGEKFQIKPILDEIMHTHFAAKPSKSKRKGECRVVISPEISLFFDFGIHNIYGSVGMNIAKIGRGIDLGLIFGGLASHLSIDTEEIFRRETEEIIPHIKVLCQSVGGLVAQLDE